MKLQSVLVLLVAALLMFGCAQDRPESAEAEQATTNDHAAMDANNGEHAEMADAYTMPDLDSFEWKDGPEGLKYTVITEGAGTDVKAGDQVQVHYTGWLKNDGTFFDSSRKRGQPFVFPLGAGRVIRGWDLGVDMMKVGGHWIFILPPEIGYGERGAGGVIPPNATLVFDVEVLGI